MDMIYTSNRLESLRQTLAESIHQSVQDVFAKEVIITQSQGMNAWLKTELAKRNGVFANFEFQNQDGFFAAVYQLLFKKRLQNNFDKIRYKIFDCLDSAEFKDQFMDVAVYYKENELRRFQLSAKITDLFDQYQLYRPDMIEGWESGNFATQNSAEIWQQWLWKKLLIDSKDCIKKKILNQLEVQKDLIKKAFPKISLFGITVYTQFHLVFFKELAKYTDVNFYLCLPTSKAEYKNELLLSYGSKAGELAGMFGSPEFTPEENKTDTLLTRIQHQILSNATSFEGSADDSLQINSCYTPVREAECLYNYLLNLFENDTTLRPRDVLVMCTDINKQAPYIKAVFKNAPVNLPFQVSGTANNSDDSMVAALEQILNFTEEDLTSEKVISLLEQKRIQQRFEIQDCNYVRSVVRKANIRFGLENRAEDDTQYVSWKVGLDKIVLGYAMLTEEEFVDKYPFRDAEASASYDLLRLKVFVSALESVIDAQKESKTLAKWKIFLLNEVMEKMVYHDDFDKEDRAELSTVYRAVSFADAPEFDQKVSFEVFLDELKTKLFTVLRETKLNTGMFTITSPIPVRGLPYRVICFLGLNNDIFPRKDRLMGFDLLGEGYREGDRNKKETDKYLFLDTILAAREKLYLSYIGQSVKDNTTIPPSIVVDTLLDYMGQEDFAVKHPMHGFSSQYQTDGQRLFTYLYAKEANEFTPKVKIQEALAEVSVYSFVKFFEHPMEWYFNTILGIKYEDNNGSLPECELFELDHLQKWQIKDDLLRLKEEGFETYQHKGIKEGFLPLKDLGRFVFEELVEETASIRSTFQALTQGKEEQTIAIDLIIDSMRITGSINGVYDRQFIACSFSKYPEKNIVRSYLKALLLSANDEIDSAMLIGSDGKCKSFTIFSTEEAKSKVKELLVYFRKGIQSPLKFTIKAIPAELSIISILKSFQSESDGNLNTKPPIPSNKYMLNLSQEGYFEDFNEDDFEEFKTLAELLTLKNAQ